MSSSEQIPHLGYYYWHRTNFYFVWTKPLTPDHRFIVPNMNKIKHWISAL